MKNKENTSQNALNIIALNQTLFKKSAIIGQGFKGGNKNSASRTPRGYHLFINGIHNLPEISEITEQYEQGSLQYPFLIYGMGDGGGEIKYWFGVTEWEYVLLVGVKLNGAFEDTDDYAVDIASFVFKDRVPFPKNKHNELAKEIVGELLIAHYTHFLGKNGAVDFKNSIESETNTFLTSVLDYYIENAENEVNSTIGNDNLSDEEKRIINEINNMSKD
jgi:hypothetical protein